MPVPLVSVLMPVYNGEKFLKEAIESILNQTFSNFEFIIIDDCSTDRSAEIILSYADNRIKYFKNEKNAGITSTLNRGIELAAATYIARMDADDISHPERLQKQYGYLEANKNCALVSSRANVVNEKKEIIYTDTTPSEFYYFKLVFTSPFFHSSVMYLKDRVIEAGKYSEAYAEDFELFWQLSRRYLFYNIPEVLLDYRVSDTSLFHGSKKREYADAVHEQCLRNIRYYAGADFQLRDSFLKCYQFEYESLLKENNVAAILLCINKLEMIATAMMEKPNPNLPSSDISGAVTEKKNDIIDYMIRKLPLKTRLHLMIALKKYASLPLVLAKAVKKKLMPGS